jgi:GNAT superfamily N-acetyltransferase
VTPHWMAERVTTMPRTETHIEIHALTPDRWEDLATLFGPAGACQGCWCMYCFFVHRKHRGRGVAQALLQAAVRFVVDHGATMVEGYPVDSGGERISDASIYTGTLPLFRRAGFQEVARPKSTRRVVMRRATGG